MKRFNPEKLREVWVIFFVLGIAMINVPFIHIFNKDTLVFGLPLLLFYFLVGWPVSILVIYLFTLGLNHSDQVDEDGEEP